MKMKMHSRKMICGNAIVSNYPRGAAIMLFVVMPNQLNLN